MIQQVFGHRLEHRAALNKGHGLQRFAAALDGKAARLRHIQPFAGDLPQRFAADGVVNSTGAAPAGLPGAG